MQAQDTQTDKKDTTAQSDEYRKKADTGGGATVDDEGNAATAVNGSNTGVEDGRQGLGREPYRVGSSNKSDTTGILKRDTTSNTGTTTSESAADAVNGSNTGTEDGRQGMGRPTAMRPSWLETDTTKVDTTHQEGTLNSGQTSSSSDSTQRAGYKKDEKHSPSKDDDGKR